MIRARPTIALLLSLSALACGADPGPPGLEALMISPTTGVKPGDTITATFNYYDDDMDIAAGKVEVALRRMGEPTGQTFEVKLSGNETGRGKIVINVVLPGGIPPGTYEIAVTVIDGGGRRSNPLSATFEVVSG
jgi:hypothetical protein